VPERRVALACRKSFPRLAAVEAVARAIHACELPGTSRLG
jgi:LysR family hydrogen peroxide-inducible transcriptional activator